MSQNARFWKLSTSPALILADRLGLELSALSGSRVPLVMFLCLYTVLDLIIHLCLIYTATTFFIPVKRRMSLGQIQQTVSKYEGWNFNSGNYLFTTDTK